MKQDIVSTEDKIFMVAVVFFAGLGWWIFGLPQTVRTITDWLTKMVPFKIGIMVLFFALFVTLFVQRVIRWYQRMKSRTLTDYDRRRVFEIFAALKKKNIVDHNHPKHFDIVRLVYKYTKFGGEDESI